MAIIKEIYFGAVSKSETVFEWKYGAIEVKETPKRYQMTEKEDSQSLHGGYKGMIIPKDEFINFGRLLSWKGQLSLEDNEELVKSNIKQDLESELEKAQTKLDKSLKNGKSGIRHHRYISELQRAISCLS